MAGDSLNNETLRTHVLFMETTFDYEHPEMATNKTVIG